MAFLPFPAIPTWSSSGKRGLKRGGWKKEAEFVRCQLDLSCWVHRAPSPPWPSWSWDALLANVEGKGGFCGFCGGKGRIFSCPCPAQGLQDANRPSLSLELSRTSVHRNAGAADVRGCRIPRFPSRGHGCDAPCANHSTTGSFGLENALELSPTIPSALSRPPLLRVPKCHKHSSRDEHPPTALGGEFFPNIQSDNPNLRLIPLVLLLFLGRGRPAKAGPKGWTSGASKRKEWEGSAARAEQGQENFPAVLAGNSSTEQPRAAGIVAEPSLAAGLRAGARSVPRRGRAKANNDTDNRLQSVIILPAAPKTLKPNNLLKCS